MFLLNAYKKAFYTKPARSPLMKFLPEIRKMFDWYCEPRFKADIQQLKIVYPALKTIENYFQ
jgi:hypothetical protein